MYFAKVWNTYTEKGVVKLLHRLGFSYKKTRQVPAKAKSDEQQSFIEEFTTLLENEPDTVVYFNDRVHRHYNTRPEYGWIRKCNEYEMPSNPGRERVSITGALNAPDITDVLAVEGDAVKSQTTVALWEGVEKKHPGKQIPHIYDNARYYRCKLIEQWLKEHPNSKVIYLPTYSPNSN